MCIMTLSVFDIMAISSVDIKVFNDKLQQYKDQGFGQQIEWAVKRARGETREYIDRTHLQTAFGGKSLIWDEVDGKRIHQTVLGAYHVYSRMISANIYANHWQRWANTGAKPHIIKWGAWKGRMSTYNYPPKTTYYRDNAGAIERYFAERLDEALKFFIKIE